MRAQVIELRKTGHRPMRIVPLPSGSMLTADLVSQVVDPSTPTKRLPHWRLFYFATLSVFLILYLLIAVEAFIVIGHLRSLHLAPSGICWPPGSRPLVYSRDCLPTPRAPLTSPASSAPPAPTTEK